MAARYSRSCSGIRGHQAAAPLKGIFDAIVPDAAEGEPPLLPVLNRYKPIGTSADVDFTTTRPCHGTQKSHVNQVVLDTKTWESSVAFRLEASDVVERYVRNDRLGLLIPYEFQGVDHTYEPDFIVRLTSGLNIILEVKGFEDAQTTAKHHAARRWVGAVTLLSHDRARTGFAPKSACSRPPRATLLLSSGPHQPESASVRKGCRR